MPVFFKAIRHVIAFLFIAVFVPENADFFVPGRA
jgi:hypothetical protein